MGTEIDKKINELYVKSEDGYVFKLGNIVSLSIYGKRISQKRFRKLLCSIGYTRNEINLIVKYTWRWSGGYDMIDVEYWRKQKTKPLLKEKLGLEPRIVD